MASTRNNRTKSLNSSIRRNRTTTKPNQAITTSLKVIPISINHLKALTHKTTSTRSPTLHIRLNKPPILCLRQYTSASIQSSTPSSGRTVPCVWKSDLPCLSWSRWIPTSRPTLLPRTGTSAFTSSRQILRPRRLTSRRRKLMSSPWSRSETSSTSNVKRILKH